MENTGFRNESRIFYFIDLQNEEDYERKESSICAALREKFGEKNPEMQVLN